MKATTATNLGSFALRVTLGLYMGLAGLGKVQGELNNGIGSFYSGAFKGLQPDWLPNFFAAPYGYALPWLELAVGGLLVLGLFTRYVAIAGLVMLISFTAALAIKNGSIAAGGPGPFNGNYIQCAAYLYFALVGAGAWALDAMITIKKKG